VIDAKKAGVWVAIAGIAHLLIVAVGAVAYPYLNDILIAVAYGLILPGIAVLHVRNARVRESGAILGTIAGTAVVAVGLSGAANVDVRPAALFVLGIWWWTIGKMWFETNVLPRTFGLATAGVGLLTFALVPAEAILGERVFSASHALLGAWLLGLAWLLVSETAG
jgi:hypothetical protein